MNLKYLTILLVVLLSFGLWKLYLERIEYYSGYRLHSPAVKNGTHISGNLTYRGWSYYLRTWSSPIVRRLSFDAEFENENELSVTLTDRGNTRFHLPYRYPFPFTKRKTNCSTSAAYRLEYEENRFAFRVIRNSTNETIFDTSQSNLIFSDKHIEFGTKLPSKYLFGLGERRRKFLYDPGVYTIYPKDQAFMINEDGEPGRQTYGQHPVYLSRERSGNYHMVLLRSTNPMDIEFDGESLTYKIVGGRIELKFFLGDKNPDTSLKLYHEYINGFTLMPFWALGFHQCRWGYKTSKDLLSVADHYNASKLPLDTIWTDIDYMVQFQDFTVDTSRFNLTEMHMLKEMGLHYIPIIDIGIAVGNNSAFKEGLEKNIFIKSAVTGTPLVNWVWPGFAAFPDFNHPNASDYWGGLVKRLHDVLPFDGLWLDMNEPSGFINGESYYYELLKPLFAGDFSVLGDLINIPLINSFLPYYPGGGVSLNSRTISTNALHENHGVFIDQEAPLTEIDFHSLNGFTEAKTTYDALKSKCGHKLPFIISRSTAFGGGSFTNHWTGDNKATWDDLRVSISSIFNFQLYGIPFVGADICGFGSPTTEELCARWMQLGSFYPFARNHYSIGLRSHEPYSWGEDSPVYKASLSSLKLRYSLLKFYYSLFIRSEGRGSIFRPLFFEFTEDEELILENNHFLLGSELLVSPVLTPGTESAQVYLPSSVTFYCFFSGKRYPGGNIYNLSVPLNSTASLLIREGAIVFINKVEGVTRTAQLDNNFTLKIAAKPSSDEKFVAEGFILGVDDYDEANIINYCLLRRCVLKIKISVSKTLQGVTAFWKVDIDLSESDPTTISQSVFITELHFYGIPGKNPDSILPYVLRQPLKLSASSQQSVFIPIDD